MKAHTKPPEPQPRVIVIEMSEEEATRLHAWLHQRVCDPRVAVSIEATQLNALLFASIPKQHCSL